MKLLVDINKKLLEPMFSQMEVIQNTHSHVHQQIKI